MITEYPQFNIALAGTEAYDISVGEDFYAAVNDQGNVYCAQPSGLPPEFWKIIPGSTRIPERDEDEYW